MPLRDSLVLVVLIRDWHNDKTVLKELTRRLEPLPSFRMIRLCVVTGLFSGYVPVAPGTAGSLVGLVGVWALYPHLNIFFQIVTALLFGFVGIWLSDSARHKFKREDPGQIVIDEIVGILFTMIGLPITGSSLVYGFLLFRIFDIVKLPPAKYFDTRLKNGWGIMMDDIISGIYANILMHLIWSTRL